MSALAELGVRARWHRAAAGPLLFALWAVFSLWCVHGFPPCVDLAAHAAQLETLKNVLRGDPAVTAVYDVQVPIGYGLPIWLFLPLAWVTNGALAARAALFVTLLLFPLSQLALLRAFRRPDFFVLLGLPLAFNISYWYGLLPGLFAQPLVFFALAAYVRSLEDVQAPRRWKWPALFAALSLGAMLSHLVAFVALCVGVAALALAHPRRLRALALAAPGVALGALPAVGKMLSMAHRAVTPGDWPATQYDLESHYAWFFQNYRPEGILTTLAPLLICAVFVLLYLRRRKVEPLGPAALFGALLLLYVATPKTLSGIFLISTRLPVLVGMASLALVDGAAVSRPLRAVLACLSLGALVQAAVFHHRFAGAVEGLAEVIRTPPPPGVHGYLSLQSYSLLGSKNIYGAHLGQWWTATHGGVGHDFFAGAEHHPVRFRDGQTLPMSLLDSPPEALERFDALLVFGDGPLPSTLEDFTEQERAGHWRKLLRTRPAPAQ